MSQDNLPNFPNWIWAIIPLGLMAVLIVLFFVFNPLKPLGVTSPPTEEVTVERTRLDDEGIHLLVRANGSQPIRIAQVHIDGAFWEFTKSPEGPMPRMSTAWMHIPYPWVKDELHEITIITHTGATFNHTIEIAEPAPEWTVKRILAYILLGVYIGVIPVGLGLMFFPFLKTLGSHGLQFLLTLTMGLLVFLLFDTMLEGMEIAERAASVFEGNVLIWLAAGLSFLIIFAIGRRSGEAPEGLSLSSYLALGIGFHNLGEGLAVGAAMVSGEAALGSFLVVGFTLHNLTEGIGIAAPLLKRKTKITTFIWLTLLAGLPASAGTLIGAFFYSPHWAVILFGIGAGAILQVLVEVGVFLSRQSESKAWLSPLNLTGFILGIGIMYGTALLVSV